jgi:hypothetical protein
MGEGWVGEEALGISLYCALQYLDDWVKGTLAAVNHSGDSDSTGSITGAILGTLWGAEAIPERWIQNVEDSQKIKKIANDMYRAFRKGEKLSFDEYPPNGSMKAGTWLHTLYYYCQHVGFSAGR